MAAEPECHGGDLIGRHMPFGNLETKHSLVTGEEAEASVCHRLKLYLDYERLYEMRWADKKDCKIDDDKIYY